MQKQLLERFISKYNLGGMIDTVPWKSNGVVVSVEAGGASRNLIVQLTCTGLELATGEYCIYETAQLRSLLNILDDDLSMTVKQHKDKPVAFTFKDNNTKVDFALADPVAMPEFPKLLGSPDTWEIEFDADARFMTSFVKSKSALNTDTFTVKATNDKVDIILGYADFGNSTRVTLSPTATTTQTVSPMKFSANCFRELLMANKEIVGKVQISEAGLMHVSYDAAPFTVHYYLQQMAGE